MQNDSEGLTELISFIQAPVPEQHIHHLAVCEAGQRKRWPWTNHITPH